MITTTLDEIMGHDPCNRGYITLLRGLNKPYANNDHDPLPLTTILEINGLDDAVWALRCIDQPHLIRKFAVLCAREVEHLMTDPRSVCALNTADLYSQSKCNYLQLRLAYEDARQCAVEAEQKRIRGFITMREEQITYVACRIADADCFLYHIATTVVHGVQHIAELDNHDRYTQRRNRVLMRKRQEEIYRAVFGYCPKKKICPNKELL